MSSMEIEDVLSSIRRLVSENLRPSILPIPQAEPAEKLILTPALRVVPDVEEEAPGAGALILEEPAPAADVAAAQAAVAERPGSDLPDPTLGAGGHAPAEAAAPHSLEAVVAAVGAAVTGQGWEGEADEADPEDDWADQAWTDPARDDHRLSAVETVEEAEVIRPGNPGEAAAVASREIEHAWATANDSEPVAVELTDEALGDLAEAEAVAQIMAAELGSEATPAEAADTAESAAPLGLFDEEDAVLDEEVLRDLVRDIIREELQGALGERITRNVRKLVRAEINRTMASRDLG